MLSVTLTLTDTDQSTKLLALLETLPFVEVQTRQQITLPDELALLDIFNRYLEYESLGYINLDLSGAATIAVFKGIYNAVKNELGPDEARAVYSALAQDPGLFEGQTITSGLHKAHCVYRQGCRVLYRVDSKANKLQVFHIAKAEPSVA